MARARARGGGLHPVVLAQVAEVQRGIAGERVIGGERDQHRILEQQLGAQTRPVPLPGPGKLEQQRHVELAGAQARGDLLGFALGERQRDDRVALTEGGDRLWHQRGSSRRERSRPQASRANPEHRRQLGLGRLDPGEDPIRVLDQAGPGCRRPDPATVPDDQGGAGLSLEPGDRLRDRRLGVGERLGRA